MSRSLIVMAGTSIVVGLMAVGWALAQLADDPSAVAARRHAGLHDRYADARLRFAEMRLQKAEGLNAAKPGEVSEADLRSLRAKVELMQAEIAETRRHPHGNGFVAQRQAAHAAVRLAEQDLQAALAVNRRRAGTISPLDVRLLDLRLEIARLRAEIWDDPAFLASTTDVLQMQIDQLVDQIQDMLLDVENAPTIQRR
jgi:hypothetical protein